MHGPKPYIILNPMQTLYKLKIRYFPINNTKVSSCLQTNQKRVGFSRLEAQTAKLLEIPCARTSPFSALGVSSTPVRGETICTYLHFSSIIESRSLILSNKSDLGL